MCIKFRGGRFSGSSRYASFALAIFQSCISVSLDIIFVVLWIASLIIVLLVVASATGAQAKFANARRVTKFDCCVGGHRFRSV